MTISPLWHTYSIKEIPFLYASRLRAETSQYLKGLRVLNNTPLSPETMLKVDCLMQAGAEVVVTETKFIKPDSSRIARRWIKEFGVQYIPDHQDLLPLKHSFDFILDCSAELFGIIEPKLGFVELTGGGTPVFKQHAASMKVPALSIDDSQLKALETFFGTSDGFMRALEEQYPQGLQNLKIVIVGYGKVGHGVAYRLCSTNSAFKPAHLTAIDIDASALTTASKLAHTTILASDEIAVKKALLEADMIVTASGAPGVISRFANRTELAGKILINLSADDDYGDAFLPSDVLANKQPLNFTIENSTHVRYLDPSLYAHNLGIELILERQLTPGYHALPADIDKAILAQWQKCHQEETSPLKRFARIKVDPNLTQPTWEETPPTLLEQIESPLATLRV